MALPSVGTIISGLCRNYRKFPHLQIGGYTIGAGQAKTGLAALQSSSARAVGNRLEAHIAREVHQESSRHQAPENSATAYKDNANNGPSPRSTGNPAANPTHSQCDERASNHLTLRAIRHEHDDYNQEKQCETLAERDCHKKILTDCDQIRNRAVCRASLYPSDTAHRFYHRPSAVVDLSSSPRATPSNLTGSAALGFCQGLLLPSLRAFRKTSRGTYSHRLTVRAA